MRLKDCFKEDFTTWLVKSNHPKMPLHSTRQLDNEEKFGLKLNSVREESLQEILDILLIHPEADYFWYGYVEHGGKLSYTVPCSDVQTVPGDSLRVDKDKVKMFLRDYKINTILNEL